jgi:hypothetical protein
MTKPDLALSQIAARFTQHDVEWSRGAFMIIDRRSKMLTRAQEIDHTGTALEMATRRAHEEWPA